MNDSKEKEENDMLLTERPRGSKEEIPEKQEEPKKPKYNMKMIEKIIGFIERSLNSKITSIEKLVKKNKKNLKKVSKDHDKLSKILKSYYKSLKSNRVSDDIKLYFALMRGNKLHLAEKTKDTKQLSKIARSKTPRVKVKI